MATAAPESFDHGIVRKWLDDDRIVVIASEGNMSRTAIDEWVRVSVETLRGWPKDRPVFGLYDLMRSQEGLTVYSVKRTEDVYRAVRSDQRVYIAIAIGDPHVRWAVNAMLRLRVGRTEQVTERLFDNQDHALQWLQQMIAREASLS